MGWQMFFQENLDSFLSIAEEFELKGLMGQGNNTREKKSDEIVSKPNNSRRNGPEQNGQLKSKCEVTRDNSTNFAFNDEMLISKFDDQRIMMPTEYNDTDLRELDERVEVDDGKEQKHFAKQKRKV